ncbi:MAG: fibronectin type III domain-containing protein [Tannerella sp.]|nr:fibronectin type III domain-containing protein [Tannerella sp.]
MNTLLATKSFTTNESNISVSINKDTVAEYRRNNLPLAISLRHSSENTSGVYLSDARLVITYTQQSPPSAPTNVIAGNITTTGCTLSWGASSGSPTKYQVYDNKSTLIKDNIPSSSTSTALTLNPNTQYSLTVVAVNATGTSPHSTPPVTVITPMIPPVITGPSTACSGSTVTFTVSDAPAGFTWGCSRTLTPISTSGNSGTFQVISAGATWVSINAGSTEVVRKNLFVGNTLSITGPDLIANNSAGSYFPEFSCSPASGTFYWTLSQSGSPALPQTGKTFSNTQSLVIKATPGTAAYTYVLEVAFGNTTVTKYIGINAGTLTMVAMIEQKLSPNPASSNVTVDVIDNSIDPASRTVPVYTIQIINMSGTAVYSEKQQGNKFNISTSSFPNGIYKVIVSDGENTAQETLIIKH